MMENNATYIFTKPSRDHHNSESFWTSVFALQILEVSRSTHQSLSIPTFHYREKEGRWFFEPAGVLKIPKCLNFQDVVVEGKIRGDFVPSLLQKIPKDLVDLRPDILIHPRPKEVWILEVKTVYNIGDQTRKYESLRCFLKDNGYECLLYLLISAGHEDKADWRLLRDPNSQITFKLLLWEQVFKAIAEQVPDSLIFRCLDSDNLAEYYIAEDEYMHGNLG